MKIILAGVTGLVGQHVLELALNSPEIKQVIALSRRPLPTHPKLLSVSVNYEDLPATADWWQADAVICTLGTTIGKAGSPEAFERVDHDYPLLIAGHALRAGTHTYVLNSAIGANPQSRFLYNRTKGRVEQDLRNLGFRSLTIARPGLIGGKRDEFRLGEGIAAVLLGFVGPILPHRWRINPADQIARALLHSAIIGEPGLRWISSTEMT